MLIAQLGYGGAESAFLRLAREIGKHHGVDIALFAEGYGIDGYTERDLPSDLRIHRLDQEPTTARIERWADRRRRLVELKRELNVDATISFLSGPNLLNAVTPGPGLRLVSVRGSRIYDAHARRLQRIFYRYLIDPVTYGLADAVVCVSQGLALETCGWRASRRGGKVRAISGYVDADALVATASAPVEPEFEALAGSPIIVTAGRLSPEKGFQHLIRVFGGVRERVADARLLIIGDGPFRPQLEQACRERGLAFGPDTSNAVIFLGFRELPHRYFRLASTFALPSSSEGFPNILVEALAAGIPVAAADTPWGAREVLGIPADPDNRPFPTARAKPTPFGYLLPRIDDPRFDDEWVEALVRLLRFPPPTPQEVKDRQNRVRQLDCAVAAKQWETLIAGLLEARR